MRSRMRLRSPGSRRAATITLCSCAPELATRPTPVMAAETCLERAPVADDEDGLESRLLHGEDGPRRLLEAAEAAARPVHKQEHGLARREAEGEPGRRAIRLLEELRSDR